MPTVAGAGPGLKLGARNLIHISDVGVRNPLLESSPALAGSWTQELEPDTEPRNSNVEHG